MADLCASCGGWAEEDCDCEPYLEAVIEDGETHEG